MPAFSGAQVNRQAVVPLPVPSQVEAALQEGVSVPWGPGPQPGTAGSAETGLRTRFPETKVRGSRRLQGLEAEPCTANWSQDPVELTRRWHTSDSGVGMPKRLRRRKRIAA